MRIIWRKSENQPREEGLITVLRGIELGQEVLVPGWRASNVNGHIRAAKRGTERWYEARTLTVGALVRRTA